MMGDAFSEELSKLTPIREAGARRAPPDQSRTRRQRRRQRGGDESPADASVMINEEDHLRMQAIRPGSN